MLQNIPVVRPGIIAVSRDCFPIALSQARRAAIVKAYGEGLYECPVTVENEKDPLKAVEDVRAGRLVRVPGLDDVLVPLYWQAATLPVTRLVRLTRAVREAAQRTL